MTNVTCPRCGCADLMKNGIGFSGRQRYKCKGCTRCFTQIGAPKASHHELPPIPCPDCRKTEARKHGFYRGKPAWKCKRCERVFTEGSVRRKLSVDRHNPPRKEIKLPINIWSKNARPPSTPPTPQCRNCVYKYRIAAGFVVPAGCAAEVCRQKGVIEAWGLGNLRHCVFL